LYLGTNDRIQYFHVTDEECSVDQITEKAREGFGNDNLILVQANGLKVEDSDVTKGIKYTLYYISNASSKPPMTMDSLSFSSFCFLKYLSLLLKCFLIFSLASF